MTERLITDPYVVCKCRALFSNLRLAAQNADMEARFARLNKVLKQLESIPICQPLDDLARDIRNMK